MVELVVTPSFKKAVAKVSDKVIRQRIKKQITKLKEQPETGKPMRYVRKGSREVYINSYRLAYQYENETIYLLDFYHKDKQ